MKSSSAIGVALLTQWSVPVAAFTGPTFRKSFEGRFLSLRSTLNDNDAAFAVFSESLEKESPPVGSTKKSAGNKFVTNEEEPIQWQEMLEMLLDPSTSPAKRQILLSDLLSENESIRESVFKALRERNIDPILTPTGRKMQDGAKSVQRQLSLDILPGLAQTLADQSRARKLVEELPNILPKVGEQVLEAFSAQAEKQLQTLQGDLQDPSRIPERLSKQTREVFTEARNVFLETPEGLPEPEYEVIGKGVGYEIREYKGYKAAATSMPAVAENSPEVLTSEGAAFNTIASYIFGANAEKQTIGMTTPVTTTSNGEMRFFLYNKNGEDSFPAPLGAEGVPGQRGQVELVDVPPAILAVTRFTGFVTDGEVSRQKEKLLASLALDGVELDVPHGAVVPYFVFQYNPPYTIPIVRRNEIAIPVLPLGEELDTKLTDEWQGP